MRRYEPKSACFLMSKFCWCNAINLATEFVKRVALLWSHVHAGGAETSGFREGSATGQMQASPSCDSVLQPGWQLLRCFTLKFLYGKVARVYWAMTQLKPSKPMAVKQHIPGQLRQSSGGSSSSRQAAPFHLHVTFVSCRQRIQQSKLMCLEKSGPPLGDGTLSETQLQYHTSGLLSCSC